MRGTDYKIINSNNGGTTAMQSNTERYSKILLASKNIILRGAPGTGKTFLAKQVAANIISNGNTDDFNLLTDSQRKQMEFVQFHPSYDYTDFVEGLRPVIKNDGTIGFELRDGILKEFAKKAARNFETTKNRNEVYKQTEVKYEVAGYFRNAEKTNIHIDNYNYFTVKKVEESQANIDIPRNNYFNRYLKFALITQMLMSPETFESLDDVKKYFSENKVNLLDDSPVIPCYFKVYSEIKKGLSQRKKYVFIIDEINRGEISKIFGELFYSVDPGYRGKAGAVSTQYANLHANPEEKLYIPENLYIIGTMNDIDRSVDSFDFAMRRRFRFVEIKANENAEEMLSSLDGTVKKEAINRMNNLNDAIAAVEDLNENYQIGASYFLKLKDGIDFGELWTDYLYPLLQDYVQGMYNEKEILNGFEEAYNNTAQQGDNGEDAQG